MATDVDLEAMAADLGSSARRFAAPWKLAPHTTARLRVGSCPSAAPVCVVVAAPVTFIRNVFLLVVELGPWRRRSRIPAVAHPRKGSPPLQETASDRADVDPGRDDGDDAKERLRPSRPLARQATAPRPHRDHTRT